jgi:hypothetical protein
VNGDRGFDFLPAFVPPLQSPQKALVGQQVSFMLCTSQVVPQSVAEALSTCDVCPVALNDAGLHQCIDDRSDLQLIHLLLQVRLLEWNKLVPMPLLKNALTIDEMQEVESIFSVVHQDTVTRQAHALRDVDRKWSCGMWLLGYYIHDSLS